MTPSLDKFLHCRFGNDSIVNCSKLGQRIFKRRIFKGESKTNKVVTCSCQVCAFHFIQKNGLWFCSSAPCSIPTKTSHRGFIILLLTPYFCWVVHAGLYHVNLRRWLMCRVHVLLLGTRISLNQPSVWLVRLGCESSSWQNRQMLTCPQPWKLMGLGFVISRFLVVIGKLCPICCGCILVYPIYGWEKKPNLELHQLSCHHAMRFGWFFYPA